MSTTENPTKLCMFVESQLLPACPFPDSGNGFCDRHNGPRFAPCGGCSKHHATHLCSCGTALCGHCTHHPARTSDPTDVGWHGPKEDAPVTEDPELGPDLTKVRDDMAKAVLLSLRRCDHEKITDDYQRALRVVHDLGTTLALTMLTGMVNATQEGTEE